MIVLSREAEINPLTMFSIDWVQRAELQSDNKKPGIMNDTSRTYISNTGIVNSLI